MHYSKNFLKKRSKYARNKGACSVFLEPTAHLVVLDSAHEAQDGDEEEEDAAGGDAADDGQGGDLVGPPAVGGDADQDEGEDL